jgi:hypothetical protein
VSAVSGWPVSTDTAYTGASFTGKTVRMSHATLPAVVVLALSIAALPGCAVVSVVGAGVGIAATTVSTAVSVAGSAISATAKVGGAVVDAVIPDGDKNEKK